MSEPNLEHLVISVLLALLILAWWMVASYRRAYKRIKAICNEMSQTKAAKTVEWPEEIG